MSGRQPERGARWQTQIAVALTLTSYALVRSGRSDYLDAPAATIAHRPRTPRSDRMVGAATEVGSVYGLAGVAVALAVRGRRSTALDVAGSGLAAWTAAQAIKPFLARERPYQLGACARLVSEPAGTSWPSGHAAVGTAMAAVVAGRTPSRRARGVLVTGVLGLGASRLYVGVHHLTDILGGIGVGLVAARSWAAGRAAMTPPDGPAATRR